MILAYSSHAQKFEIYVSDAGNFNNPPWQILKFDINGKNPSAFINSNLNWPQDILFLEASNQVLISNLGSGCITRHDATTGVFISNFACSISGPTRIKVGPDSLLYVLQWSGNGKVKRYDLSGSYLGEFTSIGVSQSIGIDWDINKNLYVSSYNGDLVRKFDTAGSNIGIFINTNLAGPTNIWFDAKGDLLVSDYDGTAVKRFDSSGVFKSNFIQGLNKSEGMAYLPNGNILIGNGSTSSIKMYDSSGVYIQDLVPSRSGNLLNPNAVVVRENQNTSLNKFAKHVGKMVSPLIGTKFNIDPQRRINLKSLVIYDACGKLVKTTSHFSQSIYLENVSEGVYFMSFLFIDGTTSVQKIIVKR